ncbi:MAG: hypothetical protein H6840_08005 [Planctomycetes bacterium]|nr:hypothetical protein [Planctomycetota bacterium]
MTELPSESELFEGRMKDGSRPPLRSHELYWHWDKPIPGGNEDLTPMQIDAEKLHQQIDTRHLAQLDKAIAFAEALVNAGLSALKNAPADPRPQADDVAQAPPPAQAVGAPPTAADRKKDSDPLIKQREEGRTPGRPIAEGSDVTVPIPPYDPDARDVDVIMDNFAKVQAALLAAGESSAVVGATTACAGDPESRTRLSGTFADANPALRACAGEGACATAASQLPLEKLLPLAEKGARLLVTASGKRAELAHKLVDRALGMDIRRSFLQDRAIGVVYATLLSLDEQFRDVGFGSWMPFRFPDQWLSFCGIMRRVLAANGLIHSKHADVYRRLLDETPPVEIEGEVQDRVKMAKTPHNPARCWENRGAENMDALRERLYHEVDHPPYPPPRKQCAPY